MAIDGSDLQKIFAAHQKASDLLNRGYVKDAARVLCAELRRVLTLQSFWQDVQSAMTPINKRAADGRALLSNLGRLIEDESRAADKLKLGKNAATAIRDVFSSVALADEAFLKGANITAKHLQNLEKDLQTATDLICKGSRSKFEKLRDAIATKKGILALAGVGVIGVDVLIFMLDGGAFSWTSVSLGYAVASGNAKDVIKILSGRP